MKIISKIYKAISFKIILLSIAFLLFAVNVSFGAITFTYDESDNKVVQTEGTEGTPATFADFVTADRAGTAELTPEDAPIACTTNSTLTYQIRPVEDLALQITFTLASTSAGAGDTLDVTGTDWRGAAQSENIDVSGGNAAYTGAKYWRTITDIDCTGWADGTLKVTQDIWGVIWDYGGGVYKLDALFEVGGGSATYFIDTNKVIILSAGLITAGGIIIDVKADATFILGEVDTLANKTTKNGCVIRALETTTYGTSIYGRADSTIYLYSLSFYGADTYAGRTDIRGALRVWNYFSSGHCALSLMGNAGDVYNYQNTGGNVGLEAITASIDKINLMSILYYALSVLTSTSITASNVYARDIGVSLIRYSGSTEDSNLIDIDTDNWQITWQGANGAAKVYRKNTVNIHVTDKDGANLAGVSILCEDQDGNTTGGFAAVTTAANGTIAEQTISRGYCNTSNINLDTDLTKDYSPHKFTLSKAGYKTLVLDNITVDGAIDWHKELQSITMPPAPFFGNLQADDYHFAKAVNE